LKSRVNFRFILMTITIAWIAICYFIISVNVENSKKIKYEDVSQKIKNELKILIDEKQESILHIALSVSMNPQVKKSIFTNNFEKVGLQDFSLKLRENSTLKNIWFQVVSVDGTSLYRSWTKKRGDNLKNVRIDVVKFLKNPQITTSISVGKFDLTFKTMVPIYEGKKFIGIIETIAKFNSIALKMEYSGYDIAVVVDKKYKKQLINTFTRIFINDYYVANVNVKQNVLEFITSKTVEHFMYEDRYHIYKKSNNLISVYHLPDIHGNPMAYLILFSKLDNIDFNKIEQDRDKIIFFFILIYLIFLGGTYYLYVMKNKSFIEALNEELEQKVEDKTQVLNHLAHHDTLTNLPNRLLFLDRLNQDIIHSDRHHKSIYVLFLDLDYFKEVNDSFGHKAGDELLKEISQRLKKCVRREDTVARFGGDEFTILISSIDRAHIVFIAEKIIARIQEPIDLSGNTVCVTFSIGISSFPSDGDCADILLRNADTAMYKAKELGKNTYQFYHNDMTKVTLARLNMENNIRVAIKKEEFQVFFQPQIDATCNKVVGCEALIRWVHPTLGMIPPNEFIPLAEKSGLIVEIDTWMMKTAINIFNTIQKKYLHVEQLSLNLSMRQLESKNYVDKLKSILIETSFNPRCLELEITENQLMNNPESSISILNEIKKLGISIAIDDFGTGYSSLSYLKYLPINKLKIDKSFVDNLPNDEDDIAIVRSIITLAKSLNLKIIAEGIERQDQKDFLLNEGCPYMQGYFYSKPLNKEDFMVYLKN